MQKDLRRAEPWVVVMCGNLGGNRSRMGWLGPPWPVGLLVLMVYEPFTYRNRSRMGWLGPPWPVGLLVLMVYEPFTYRNRSRMGWLGPPWPVGLLVLMV